MARLVPWHGRLSLLLPHLFRLIAMLVSVTEQTVSVGGITKMTEISPPKHKRRSIILELWNIMRRWQAKSEEIDVLKSVTKARLWSSVPDPVGSVTVGLPDPDPYVCSMEPEPDPYPLISLTTLLQSHQSRNKNEHTAFRIIDCRYIFFKPFACAIWQMWMGFLKTIFSSRVRS